MSVEAPQSVVVASACAEAGRLDTLLREDPERGLTRLTRIAASVDSAFGPPDLCLALFDTLRPAWRRAVADHLAPIRGAAIPLHRDEQARIHLVGQALRAVRAADERIGAALQEREAVGQGLTPRVLLALARALDTQSLLLVSALRLRVGMPREDWEALCRLAAPLLEAGALDEGFVEPTGRVGRPRAALVTPLLMRLVEPLGLTTGGLELAWRLARDGASGVGIRLGRGDPPARSPLGPVLVLPHGRTVELETRSLVRRLRRLVAHGIQRGPAGALSLNSGLSPEAAEAVIARIEPVWAAGYRALPLGRPPAGHALLLAGLPGGRASTAAGLGRVDPLTLPLPGPKGVRFAAGSAQVAYVFGRRSPDGDGPSGGSEQGTAAGPGSSVATADSSEVVDAELIALMNGAADPVVWHGQDVQRSVFGRSVASARLKPGQLVAVLPLRSVDRAKGAGRPRLRPDAQPQGLRVGRVVSLVHTGVPGAREPDGHDVGVAFWTGTPRAVRVRLGRGGAREDGWWLRAATPEETSSLVLGRDRFVADCPITIYEGTREIALTGIRLLERGPDFDRIEVVPAIAAAGPAWIRVTI